MEQLIERALAGPAGACDGAGWNRGSVIDRVLIAAGRY